VIESNLPVDTLIHIMAATMPMLPGTSRYRMS
jgi:hypothetical protein